MKKLLLAYLTLLSIGVSAQLNGTYTIGGTSPNYTTINDAVTDLTSQGVSGPVVFNLRAGTYNEQITLQDITGSSFINNITFQSESGNNTGVELTGSGTKITLDSASNFIFDALTFNGSIGLLIKNSSNNLTISNSIFNTSNRGISRSEMNTTGFPNEDVSILNNVFNGGGYGVNIWSQSDVNSRFITVTGNEFHDQTDMGVWISGCSDYSGNNNAGALIENNILVTKNSSTYSYTGIFVNGIYDTLNLSKNLIIIKTNTTDEVRGIRVDGPVSAGSPHLLSNNIIEIEAPLATEISGIFINGRGNNMEHNSIVIDANPSGISSGLYLFSASNGYNHFNNNDVVNLTTGATSYFIRSGNLGSANLYHELFNNNFYGSGSNFSDWNLTIYPTLSSFESAFPTTASNNIQVNSGFAIDSNYNATLCGNLAGLGMPIPYIANDYNGLARSGTAPTIGAIETVGSASQSITAIATSYENCVEIIDDTLSVLTFVNGFYTWTNSGSPISTENLTVISTTTSDVYNVDWTSGACFSNTATVNLTVHALPVVIANASNTSICDGDATTLSGSGATTYVWDNGVTDGDSFVPTATTTYTVTGTDANGCTNTDVIDITVNTLPSVIANTSASTLCSGGATTLTGNGATTYAWNNGITDAVSFVPSATTTYTVTGTDANGCVNTDMIDVTVNALPLVTANASSLVVCEGDTTILTGSGALTYSWDNGVTDGSTFVPTATNTYTVTGTDANGCINIDFLDITVNTLPTPAIIISGVDLSSDITGTSYQWYLNGVTISGATAQNYTAGADGDYTVEVTNGNGCIGISAIENIIGTGVSEGVYETSLKVYPNPTNGIINIESSISIQSVQLIDLTGKVIDIFYTNSFNLSTYSKGIYLLRIITINNEHATKQICLK